MNFQLTDEQQEWKDYCRKFAVEVMRPVAPYYDRARVSESVSVLTISARTHDSTVSVVTDRLQAGADCGSLARNLYASTLAPEVSVPPMVLAGTSVRPSKPAGFTATPASTETETNPVNFRAPSG